jgi:hypothetical protein
MRQSYFSTWVPRVGPEVTLLGWRSFQKRAAAVLFTIVVGFGTIFVPKAAHPVVYSLYVLLVIILCVIWLRSRLKLRDAMSRYFNKPIAWPNGMPPMIAGRPEVFDTWCQQHNFIAPPSTPPTSNIPPSQ